jgi:hypothetical protein
MSIFSHTSRTDSVNNRPVGPAPSSYAQQEVTAGQSETNHSSYVSSKPAKAKSKVRPEATQAGALSPASTSAGVRLRPEATQQANNTRPAPVVNEAFPYKSRCTAETVSSSGSAHAMILHYVSDPNSSSPVVQDYNVVVTGRYGQERVSREQADNLAFDLGHLLELVSTKHPNFDTVHFEGGNGQTTFARAIVYVGKVRYTLGGETQTHVEAHGYKYGTTYAAELQSKIDGLLKILRAKDEMLSLTISREQHKKH